MEGEKVAHTAEHAFVGALQKILGQTLQVRKVEHKKDGSSNTAFIVIPQLDIDTVVRAEVMVNALIEEGRQVTTRTYPSLAEARNANPTLRANEERISGGEVRVVEIAGHDVTACVKEHAGNLQECGFFLVTRLSKSGGEYEVDFAVGRHAKEAAVSLSAKMIKVCSELGANLNTVENTARKVRLEGESAFKKLKALSREKLQSITPAEESGSVRVYSGVFSGLADEALQEFAGEKVAEPGVVVVIANAGAEGAYFILARHEAINLDCNKAFREAAGADGRGGGKPHFVTGVVKKERAGEIVAKIADAALRQLG
ncbi:alanyl-tRNA editing protein [Nitrososphaera viennensis]|uniref:Uncharacterized protein n=2 Tax=Nitrososphaera viennensis TaxID=1034015 RepID=A0A977NNK8_9ARCH|nr:hypothetical protein [Nitrososphaera viennensis]UVS70532.1 hypothetical protein NWT39_07040 [Nitrososphaera viennensis]